jgi:hypothetical protein
MSSWKRLVIGWLSFLQREKKDLLLETLALRHQVLILPHSHPRPRSTRAERLYSSLLTSMRGDWNRRLILLQPETALPMNFFRCPSVEIDQIIR